jgi:hypothetical protein
MKQSDATVLLHALRGGDALSNEEVYALLNRSELRSVYENRKDKLEKYGVDYEDFTRLLCLILYLRRPSGGLSNQ